MKFIKKFESLQYIDIDYIEGEGSDSDLNNRVFPITQELKTEENIYINRLKEQYIAYVMARNSSVISTESKIYMGMRLLCLDCSLLSFAEIELMEDEIDSKL